MQLSKDNLQVELFDKLLLMAKIEHSTQQEKADYYIHEEELDNRIDLWG